MTVKTDPLSDWLIEYLLLWELSRSGQECWLRQHLCRSFSSKSFNLIFFVSPAPLLLLQIHCETLHLAAFNGQFYGNHLVIMC